MKIHGIIVVIIVMFILICYFVNSPKYFRENGVVCHAGGILDGYKVTNSLDAFESNYDKGHRFFEVDICTTADGVVVCSHGFTESDYINRYIQEDVQNPPYHPTYEEFKTYRIGADYTIMSLADFMTFMKSHKDVHCLLDIKLCDKAEAAYIAQEIYNTAGKKNVLSRLIMSARTPDMVYGYWEIYEFPYMHLLYAEDSVRDERIYTPEEFLEFCKWYHITSFSVSAKQCTKELVTQLKSTGLKSYVYMVENSFDAQRFMDMGIDFLISDTLNYDELSRLGEYHNLGLKVTREKKGLLLEWNVKEDVKEYQVFRRDDTSENIVLTILKSSENQYLDTSAKQDILYTYQICAILENGEKILSVPEEFLWLKKPIISVVEDTANGILMRWNVSDNAMGYTIKRKYENEDDYKHIKTLDENVGEYIDNTQIENASEKIYYRIQAYTYKNGKIYYSGYCPKMESRCFP